MLAAVFPHKSSNGNLPGNRHHEKSRQTGGDIVGYIVRRAAKQPNRRWRSFLYPIMESSVIILAHKHPRHTQQHIPEQRSDYISLRFSANVSNAAVRTSCAESPEVSRPTIRATCFLPSSNERSTFAYPADFSHQRSTRKAIKDEQHLQSQKQTGRIMRCPTQQEQCKQINACRSTNDATAPFRKRAFPLFRRCSQERDGAKISV